MKTLSAFLWLLLPTFAFLSPAKAQSNDDPDFDPEVKALSVIGPNSGADFVVRSPIALTAENMEIRANLVIAAGGHLRISHSTVRVKGDVVLADGGVLHISDSRLNLANTYPRQFNYWWRGGHLVTERVTIGGTKVNGVPQISNLWLNAGLWDAFQTTVECSGGILLGWSRWGFNGQPDQKGGTLHANGLFQGEFADALHMSGMGDATVTNSVFNVGLYVYADGSAPLATTLNLDTKNPIAGDVYGDPGLHAGVTRPLPASPFRLELNGVTVPSWSLLVMNASMSGAPVELVLENADAVVCSFHGADITGTPALGGDWSQFGTAPGLPSTMIPGWHPMPPGASVRLGNVTYKAGRTPVTIPGWGLYLVGGGTDITIPGPCQIFEIWLQDGRLTLDGTTEYGAGIGGNTVELHGTATLNLRQAAIGEFGTARSTRARINVYGRARCVIDRARISDTDVTTLREDLQNGSFNVDAASITVANGLLDGKLNTFRSAGGSISVATALPSETFDLQNLDFERGIQGNGAPEFWTLGSGSTSRTSDRRPGGTGGACVRYQTSSSAVAAMSKDLRLSAGSQVQVFGWAKLGNAAGGGVLDLRVEGQGGLARKALAGTTGVWQLLQVPTYTLGSGETSTRISLGASAPAAYDVTLDDFRVHVGNWWENDNLLNLDFEGGYRDHGRAPTFWLAPDGWKVWDAQCAPETSVRRPGAAPGSRSMKLTSQNVDGFMVKDLTFLAPGDKLTLTGWIRGDPAPGATCYSKVQIGEGNDFWNTGNGVNKAFSGWGDGTWLPFSIDYVVPAPPIKQAFTRIAVGAWGAAGNVVYVDDIKVVIKE